MLSGIDWPPPYTLRISAQAKRLQLKIDARGIVLVCPVTSSREDALDFLNANRSWVLKHMDQATPEKFVWPEEINLAANDQHFSITYCWGAKRASMQTSSLGCVKCFLPVKDPHLFKQLFRRWLVRQARSWLLIRLEDLSEFYGLPYRYAAVRCQKTRWGSCSANKDISLNAQLMFFPSSVVDYVITHELCHTIYMNHSKDFWSMVEAYLPNYRESIKRLTHMHQAVMYV